MDNLKKHDFDLICLSCLQRRRKVFLSNAHILAELEFEELDNDSGNLKEASKKHSLPEFSDTRWASRLSLFDVLLTVVNQG